MNTLGKKRSQFIFFALMIPVVLLGGFVVYPAASLLRMSFFEWDGASANQTFVGVANYVKMLTASPELWRSLGNNLLYLVVTTVFIPIEMLIAVMLNSKMKGTGFVKTIIFLPFVISGVGISYAFAYFFSPVNGAFNSLLGLAGLEGWIRNWLSDPTIVNWVLCFVVLWRYSGYHVILFISALKSISPEILEAVELDGANAWQKFRYIQVPSIRLVLDFIIFDNLRGALQQFEIAFVMTSGGPGYASSTFTLYTIDTAFKFNNFGLASTMAVTIMVIILVLYGARHLVSRRMRKE